MPQMDIGKLFLVSMICLHFINVTNGATTTTASTVTGVSSATSATTASGTASTAAATTATAVTTTAAVTTTTAAPSLPPAGTTTDGYNPPMVSQTLFNQLVALFGPTAAFDLLYGVRNAANNFGGSYYINTIGSPSSGGIVQTSY
ncbi:hypothetical protein RRG08_034411 [Elysia crispata]|uniref:Uncharacterized protein n=1 Tax=Elysia crispata TaxID=231223 RepID=A0AAE0YD82_9GAST|nr:hypothetical protein RRG08_034411 [Elysia crispata]